MCAIKTYDPVIVTTRDLEWENQLADLYNTKGIFARVSRDYKGMGGGEVGRKVLRVVGVGCASQ